MGLLSFLTSSFKDSCSYTQQEKSPPRSTRNVPHTKDLMYPATLPSFGEIADGGHSDPRAAIYAMLWLDPERKRPFPDAELNALDFGGEKIAYRVLLEKNLIRELGRDKMLASIFSKDELKGFLRDRGLPISGSKQVLSERLLNSGFRLDERKCRHKLFELTEIGGRLIKQYRSDERLAIRLATSALKDWDYSGAVSAYRDFDSRWGFVHTSGKNHTIFAHYDVPFRRLEFMANYPMFELNNSDDFKNALRACLFAGLMRGCQDRMELAQAFEDVCPKQIQCPRIVDYFEYGHFDDEDIDRDSILAAMRENVSDNNRYVLEYYISRVMHLSRK